jgi:polyribonucleotide nucleotidyltransferase
MDAGVPLPRSVAGIAMGLIKEGERFTVLSDILGDEDHLGDMDFKVAGTEIGVTSLQMDIKIAGITEEIMRVALHQAREGRIHILGEMAKAMGQPRPEMRETVPRVTTINIPTDKIGAVIGAGGKTIREITERTGTKIDIGDDGTIKIASSDALASQRAVDWIRGLTASAEVGRIYEGKVARIVEFGAFVNFLGAHDGLVHISELANERVGKVSDVVKEGDLVKVKVLAVDERGKVKLSMRAVDQATGEELAVAPRPPRGDGGPRREEGDRGRGGFDRDRDRDRRPRGEFRRRDSERPES